MIESGLTFLRSELEAGLRERNVLESDQHVRLANVVDQSGDMRNGSLAITLVHLAEETAGKEPYQVQRGSNATPLSISPAPLKLNLDILVTACINTNEATSSNPQAGYSQALKWIDATVQFFHARSCFTPETAPRLPDSIEKLLVNLSTISLQDQHNLWGVLGSKYMPSVLYRVRLIEVTASVAKPVPLVKRKQLSLS